MKLHNTVYDLDLDQLKDETLVVLAKECGYGPAERFLLLRYWAWTGRLIRALAYRRGLSGEDTEDAVQDAVFGILKAIARYDTLELGKRKGCSFQSFLRRVLGDRFKDFVKHLWRVRARYRRSLNEVHELEDAGGAAAHTSKEADPGQAIAWAEWKARFGECMAQLDDSDRQLLDVLSSGESLRVAAARLDTSYDKTKRRWRRLRSELAGCLQDPIG